MICFRCRERCRWGKRDKFEVANQNPRDVKMVIEPLLMFIPMIIIVALIWANAKRIYQLHSQIRKESPFLYKLIGANEKDMDAPEIWIKHFRLQLTLIAGLISGTFLVFLVLA